MSEGGIFTPGINKGAYQGDLICPFVVNGVDCGSKAIRYVEHVSKMRLRYRCRKCGNTFQYDISNAPPNYNPYAPYRKGRIWSKIEEKINMLYGRNALKEDVK